MAFNTQRLCNRPAGETDLLTVATFVQSAQELFYSYPSATWPLTPAQLARAMAERTGSTVALLDQELAGFANFYQYQPQDFCALGNMMIAPNARGQGVARYLIGVMEQLARSQFEAKRMRVSCFSENTAGLLLYSQLGYQPLAIVERKTAANQRVALIQMDKAL